MGNENLGYRGVQTIGSGFIVTPQQAASWGLGKVEGLEKHIRDYRNGRDIAQRPRGVMVIDLFGLEAEQVQKRFPAVYQHILTTVKPDRDQNNRKSYRESWWVFGEPRGDMRPVLAPLPRYITTIETAKHRFFQFLDASVLPDNRLVNIGVSKFSVLAALSSRAHVHWTLSVGGVLEDRPIYTKTATFDPFPFPPCVTDESNPALRNRLAKLGERLDGFRKQRLAEHEFLTMTGMYNVLERIRELEWANRDQSREAGAGASISPLAGEMSSKMTEGGEAAGTDSVAIPPSVAPRHLPRKGGDQGRAAGLDPSFGPRRKGGDQLSSIPPLSDAERDIHEAGLISVLKDIHDEIDRAVFEAYGWSDLGERLIGRPGATMPSPHKSPDQELAEEELLTRLVALNVERQAEEARGHVRWLRPDYQIPKLGHKVARPDEMRQDEAELIVVAASDKPKWPKDAFEQVRIVKEVLSIAPAPARAHEIEAAFDGRSSAKRKTRVDEVLRLLTETGGARAAGSDPEPRYFVAR